MNIYIKKVKNSKGQEKEWLWINYTINGKRFRKPLDMENTKSNYKRAENEILPLLQYKLLNGELNQNKKIPTVDEYMKFSFELHSGGRGKTTIYGHQKKYDKPEEQHLTVLANVLTTLIFPFHYHSLFLLFPQHTF